MLANIIRPFAVLETIAVTDRGQAAVFDIKGVPALVATENELFVAIASKLDEFFAIKTKGETENPGLNIFVTDTPTRLEVSACQLLLIV